MHVHLVAVFAGLIAIAAPALADSIAVTSGPNGTTVVNGKPCRVVTGKAGSNRTNTTITAGSGQVSGSTTVSPGGSGSSVVVGSGSSGGTSSSAGSVDCVVRRPRK